MRPRVVGWWVLIGIVQVVGSIFFGVMNQWMRAWNGAVQVMGSISRGKKAKSGWMVGLEGHSASCGFDFLWSLVNGWGFGMAQCRLWVRFSF